MQTYPVSREAKKSLDIESLKRNMAEALGDVTLTMEGDMIATSFLAVKKLRVGTDGKSLLVETLMEPKVPEKDQIETIKRYNLMLELCTGFTAKERAKRLQAEAKKREPH